MRHPDDADETYDSHDDPPSPLDVLATTFRLLTTGPAPLALDCSGLGYRLPRRRVPLDELKVLLLHPATRYAARDAALAALVRRARAERGAWLVGLAGVLEPGLRRTAGYLARQFPGDPADLDAEVLACFLEAVEQVDPDQGRLAGRLLGITFTRTRQLRRAELRHRQWTLPLETTAEPSQPGSGGSPVGGHPDFILARAVRCGVISRESAALIGATRLEAVDLGDLAAASRHKPDTLRHRRYRAEQRLIAWIHAGMPAHGHGQPDPTGRPSASEAGSDPDRRSGRDSDSTPNRAVTSEGSAGSWGV